MDRHDFIKVFAIKVSQPLGDFFITKIKAEDLLAVSFSEELQYIDENGKLKGSQRKTDAKRLEEIAKYIDSVEMSFPNSVILAANYTEEGEVLSEDIEDRWILKQVGKEIFEIWIPLKLKLAAIIDGQHRINAFRFSKVTDRLGTEIPCSIFFDLPNSYQAFLFATVNGNQRKVDRSLALEQFGFNVEDEPRKSWTPEKLAVYYSRKLNIKDTPFHHHIRVAPRDDNYLVSSASKPDWFVSTSTIVDGINQLITKNAKRDRVEMQQELLFKSRSRKLIENIKDDSPLRLLYLKGEESSDEQIYQVVVDFFTQIKNYIWDHNPLESYIVKTIGVQASFDFLKQILIRFNQLTNNDFTSFIIPFQRVNFSDPFFQQASGIGRARIRNLMYIANGWDENLKIKEEDRLTFKRLLTSEMKG